MGIRVLATGLFLLFVLAVAPASAAARYCEQIRIDVGPQKELEACLVGVLNESDARLNASFRKYRATISENAKKQAVLLRDSQRAWIEYRDMNCAWLAPYSAFSPEVIRMVCLIEMTNLRTDDFVGWLAAGSAIPDHAPQCGPRDLTKQWNEESAACEIKEKKYESADGDLNDIYTKYMEHYRENSAKQEIEAMRAAQRAWIKYRDLNCVLWAYIEGYEGKSPDCLTKMTADRVDEYKEVPMRAEYGDGRWLGGHTLFGPYEYSCNENQITMNQCAQASFEIGANRLYALYGELFAVADGMANSELQNEKKAWLTQQERECRDAAKEVESGSMWPLMYYSCKEELNKKQIRLLESKLGDARQ